MARTLSHPTTLCLAPKRSWVLCHSLFLFHSFFHHHPQAGTALLAKQPDGRVYRPVIRVHSHRVTIELRGISGARLSRTVSFSSSGSRPVSYISDNSLSFLRAFLSIYPAVPHRPSIALRHILTQGGGVLIWLLLPIKYIFLFLAF